MVGDIVLGVILVAIPVGFWFTRNAKGPSGPEIAQKQTEERAGVGPTGEPTGWFGPDDPKPPANY